MTKNWGCIFIISFYSDRGKLAGVNDPSSCSKSNNGGGAPARDGGGGGGNAILIDGRTGAREIVGGGGGVRWRRRRRRRRGGVGQVVKTFAAVVAVHKSGREQRCGRGKRDCRPAFGMTPSLATVPLP